MGMRPLEAQTVWLQEGLVFHTNQEQTKAVSVLCSATTSRWEPQQALGKRRRRVVQWFMPLSVFEPCKRSSRPANPGKICAMDDSWRGWIFENLSMGSAPPDLARIMDEAGVDPVAGARELEHALKSPYLPAAKRMHAHLSNRVKKREWVLEIYQRLRALQPGAGEVPRKNRLGGEAFVADHYSLNLPVIITGMMCDWPALTAWTPDALRSRFGERQVEVQAGRTKDEAYEINSSAHKRTMRFDDFVDVISSGVRSNDHYMTANNSSKNKQALREMWADMRPLPEYLTPDGDAGFLWIGPGGTITPFHHDLTNNFMAQVRGYKKVKLIAASELPHVYNHLHCYTQLDGGAPDYARYPRLRQARIIECTIGPGEILFVPVGWWHYVEALEPSITMSFTNFRAGNDFHTSYTTYSEV
jgi:hypothetical protein